MANEFPTLYRSALLCIHLLLRIQGKFWRIHTYKSMLPMENLDNVDKIKENLTDIKEDGTLRLEMSYFK